MKRCEFGQQKNGCHGSIPCGIEKVTSDRSFTSKVLQSLHANVVKIGMVDVEIIGQKEITKIYFKHMNKTYSPPSASLKPGGLNYVSVT